MNQRPLPRVSVVIPVYNSSMILPKLIERLNCVVPKCASAWEIILVNDASQDQSWEIIKELSSRFLWIRGIDLLRNVGQHNALLCGIRHAEYDTIITIDDDLQNPPEEIPALLVKLESGLDAVYGVPEHPQHGFLRDIASTITKIMLQNGMGAEIARNISAFRAFRSQLRESFEFYRGPFVSIDVLLTWGTTRFGSVRVRHEPRSIGSSGYTLRSLITHAVNMMTGFSVVPLQFASIVGFGFTVLGFVTFSYVLGRFLIQGSPVPGFPFLASIIAIFSGAQLFALGVIGEYLARIHFRLMDRPVYTIRTTTAPKPKS